MNLYMGLQFTLHTYMYCPIYIYIDIHTSSYVYLFSGLPIPLFRSPRCLSILPREAGSDVLAVVHAPQQTHGPAAWRPVSK